MQSFLRLRVLLHSLSLPTELAEAPSLLSLLEVEADSERQLITWFRVQNQLFYVMHVAGHVALKQVISCLWLLQLLKVAVACCWCLYGALCKRFRPDEA